MAKLLVTLPDDVHQALRIASIIEHQHQYVLVIKVLREYLVDKGHLKGDTQLDREMGELLEDDL